jgi:hypothetical protein
MVFEFTPGTSESDLNTQSYYCATRSVGYLDNTHNDIMEIRWEVVDWIRLAQDRDRWRDLVNTVVILLVS